MSGQQHTQWSVDLLVAGCLVPFKVDTGASCNVVPLPWYNKFENNKKLLPGPRVRTYNGQSLTVLGQHDVTAFFNSKQFTIRVIVIKEENVPILGLPSCCDELCLNQIPQKQVSELVVDASFSGLPSAFQAYKKVFIGIGKLPIVHEIKLKDNCVPVVLPPRRIPLKIRDPVKKKLDDMEKLKLICKVTEPTEWVHPMLAVQKSGGDINICLDPLDLNKVIKRQHYPVPTAQELFARIGKAKFFSTLNATSRFLQVSLSEDSSFLTTFATSFGRYHFLRLPFGICSATEVYQQTMEQLFGDLPGVELYLDDFFVWSETREEHDMWLKAVFDRCVKVDLKLNATKCKFLQSELPWIGHIISHQQLKLDPDKVGAIRSFKEPA